MSAFARAGTWALPTVLNGSHKWRSRDAAGSNMMYIHSLVTATVFLSLCMLLLLFAANFPAIYSFLSTSFFRCSSRAQASTCSFSLQLTLFLRFYNASLHETNSMAVFPFCKSLRLQPTFTTQHLSTRTASSQSAEHYCNITHQRQVTFHEP